MTLANSTKVRLLPPLQVNSIQCSVYVSTFINSVTPTLKWRTNSGSNSTNSILEIRLTVTPVAGPAMLTLVRNGPVPRQQNVSGT